jgi:hypothetical protein
MIPTYSGFKTNNNVWQQQLYYKVYPHAYNPKRVQYDVKEHRPFSLMVLNLQFRNDTRTYFLHIFIQSSFKFIIEFVRSNVGLIYSIVDLKMRCVGDICIRGIRFCIKGIVPLATYSPNFY